MAPNKIRPIFVAATRQHVGKTSVSLALCSGLQKRFGKKLGFIKPVGQGAPFVRLPASVRGVHRLYSHHRCHYRRRRQHRRCRQHRHRCQHDLPEHVPVMTESGEPMKVDKDVKLIRSHFGLDHMHYEHMSPAIIPRGYTKQFIDGEVDREEQRRAIMTAFNETNAKSDVMLLEGTGHVGVGACVDASNAQVARMLNADMVLVANGGIGKSFDELYINHQACQINGVHVAGVVVNKVIPSKVEEVRSYMSRLLERWDVPLLGVVPDNPFLGYPALADFERLFQTKLLSGEEHRMRHFNVEDTILVTTGLDEFMKTMRSNQDAYRALYVTHVSRNDVILAFISEHQRKLALGLPSESALVLCGDPRFIMQQEINDMVTAGSAPILHVRENTWKVMTKIANFTPKLNIEDTARVAEAIEWYESKIDFDELTRRASEDRDRADVNVPGAAIGYGVSPPPLAGEGMPFIKAPSDLKGGLEATQYRR